MVHDELPKYLLAPEVSALLHYVPDLRRDVYKRQVLGKYRRLQIEACTQPRQRYRCRIPGQALYLSLIHI